MSVRKVFLTSSIAISLSLMMGGNNQASSLNTEESEHTMKPALKRKSELKLPEKTKKRKDSPSKAKASNTQEIASTKHNLVVVESPEHSTLYNRLLSKQYVAEQFVGVKTTGIACRFGCPAKTPNQENVEFSKSLYDLITLGYRECKVCKPLTFQAAPAIKDYLDSLQTSFFPEKAIPPEALEAKRWFQQTHNAELQRYIYVKRIYHLLRTPGNAPTSLTTCYPIKSFGPLLGRWWDAFQKRACVFWSLQIEECSKRNLRNCKKSLKEDLSLDPALSANN